MIATLSTARDHQYSINHAYLHLSHNHFFFDFLPGSNGHVYHQLIFDLSDTDGRSRQQVVIPGRKFEKI
jgi:hypothetical protein